jgi:hypothetical protein
LLGVPCGFLVWGMQRTVVLIGEPPEEVEDGAMDVDHASSDSDPGDGDMALAPEESWWQVQRQWAEAAVEAGPVAAAGLAVRRLRTVQQTATQWSSTSPTPLMKIPSEPHL